MKGGATASIKKSRVLVKVSGYPRCCAQPPNGAHASLLAMAAPRRDGRRTGSRPGPLHQHVVQLDEHGGALTGSTSTSAGLVDVVVLLVSATRELLPCHFVRLGGRLLASGMLHEQLGIGMRSWWVV